MRATQHLCERYARSVQETRSVQKLHDIWVRATWGLCESYTVLWELQEFCARATLDLCGRYMTFERVVCHGRATQHLCESDMRSVRELYSTQDLCERCTVCEIHEICTVCEICARATRDLWESYTFLWEWHKFYARATRDLRRHYMTYLQELCDSCVRVTSGLDKSYTRSVKELSESYPRCLWELGDLCERYARPSQEVHATSMQELNARCQWERSWRELSRRSAWDHELHEHVPGSVQKLNESSMKAPGKICKVIQPWCETYLLSELREGQTRVLGALSQFLYCVALP